MRLRTAALIGLLSIGACTSAKILLDKGPDTGDLAQTQLVDFVSTHIHRGITINFFPVELFTAGQTLCAQSGPRAGCVLVQIEIQQSLISGYHALHHSLFGSLGNRAMNDRPGCGGCQRPLNGAFQAGNAT